MISCVAWLSGKLATVDALVHTNSNPPAKRRHGGPGSRRDCVGESRNPMEQIHRTHDFPIVSSSAASRIIDQSVQDSFVHAPAPSTRLNPPSTIQTSFPSSAANTTNSKRSIHSSLGYRRKAAGLVVQIKDNVKTTRRLFSSGTGVSRATRQ